MASNNSNSMMIRIKLSAFLFYSFLILSGFSQRNDQVICGDARLDQLLPLLENKNVALLVNQTAVLGSTHLADTLLVLGVRIKKILAPEHGFRGETDAGEQLRDSVDAKTRI